MRLNNNLQKEIEDYIESDEEARNMINRKDGNNEVHARTGIFAESIANQQI
jgi:hypothetical protein